MRKDQKSDKFYSIWRGSEGVSKSDLTDGEDDGYVSCIRS